MDSTGKIVWAKHNEVQQAVLGKVGESIAQMTTLPGQCSDSLLSDEEVKDGEPVPLSPKDIGTCEIYPQTLAHNPNGRCVYAMQSDSLANNRHYSFVVVCGDGEYIIHTAQAFRNKAFGQALDFVWSADSSEYVELLGL